jgi:hypothetical protein
MSTGDEVDRAQLAIDQHLEFAIKKSRVVTAHHTGFCLYCKEECAKRFCDVYCRDDYDAEEKIRKIRGLYT